MLAVLLALAAAVSYSASDYTAGLAARSADVIRVTLVDEVTFSLLLMSIAPFVSSRMPPPSALVWGAAAGISGVAAAMMLYLGFRYTVFSVPSSVSAVGSAAFSAIAGVVLGERPGSISLAGIALALPAIVLVSLGSSQSAIDSYAKKRSITGHETIGMLCGLGAGAGFGLFFICLNRAGSGTDLWPLATAGLAGAIFAICVAALKRQLGLPPPGMRWLSVLSGITAAAGTFSYFLATHRGLLAVTAVITSLSPAGTVLLARLLISERLTMMRIIGLFLAATSVGLIAVAGAS